MSTPQHTPGPWIAKGAEVFYRDTEIVIADTLRSDFGFGTENANARLIAAAPDLLAELIACEDQLRGVTGALPGSDSAEVCDAARAAIARATAK